jgi:hypothetical protein
VSKPNHSKPLLLKAPKPRHKQLHLALLAKRGGPMRSSSNRSLNKQDIQRLLNTDE